MSSPIAFPITGSAGSGNSSGGQPAFVKALLELHEPSGDGSRDKPGPWIGVIEFQFNPKELTWTKSARWAPNEGKGHRKSGPTQFQGAEPSKLTLEMFFDATDSGDRSVLKRVEKLIACCVPTRSSQDKDKGNPPWVIFKWGTTEGFLAYIKSVTAKYTLFAASGMPLRAVCTVQLEDLAGEPKGQNPTSGGLVPRHVHVVRDGDSLAGIAHAEYGDPSAWRAIALANRVDDPLHLTPGTSLLLPEPEAIYAR